MIYRLMKIASKIASDVMKEIESKEVEAFDMTEREWEIYHKQHPRAKKQNHNIIPVPGDSYNGKNYKDYMRRETKAKRKYFRKLQKKHPNFVPIISKDDLMKILKDGEYTCISAGINNESESDIENAKRDKDFIKKRTEQLRSDLDKLGVKYTEIAGSYGGEEPSFLISHSLEAKVGQKNRDNSFLINRNKYDNNKMIEALNKLGEKYNQDSVSHCRKGVMEWHYTTGDFAGKTGRGSGTDFVKGAKDFYSEARVGDKDFTMWTCDMSRLFNNKGKIKVEELEELEDNPYFKPKNKNGI